MKKYFTDNLKPILIGMVIAYLTITIINTVENVIIKIELIKEKNRSN